MSNFCRENALPKSSMCNVSTGIRTDYNGWKCFKLENGVV